MVLSRARWCPAGCQVEVLPLTELPKSPDFWVRSSPAGGWLSSDVYPAEDGESAGGRAYRCPECHASMRLVYEPRAIAHTA